MTISFELSRQREADLLEELRFALERTSRGDLKQWGSRSTDILASVTIRRARNFRALATRVGAFFSEEGGALLNAIRRGVGWKHASERAVAANERAREIGIEFHGWYATVNDSLRNNPRETAPKMAAGLLGFLVGSGGTDGDGGVPDLDLLGGIGAHRSILTHSVLAGIVLETLILSFLDLSRTVYANLPEEHDGLWEELNTAGDDIFGALSEGLSLGIAYHLGVDATVDGAGTYKDLPVSLPQDAHQGILAGNAAVEGVDGMTRVREERREEIEGALFTSFQDAANYAKQRPGWVIVRATETKGFRVTRKVPRADHRRSR